MSINKVIISGNLTRDPELRQTASGQSILGFGMAVNDRRKNPQTGEWEDYTNWVDCTMFGARAQAVSQYLSKGSKVAVEGKLRWSQWERDGQKRSKVEVIVDEIELMSRGEGQQRVQQQPQGQPVQGWGDAYQSVQSGQQYQAPQPVATYADSEIPF